MPRGRAALALGGVALLTALLSLPSLPTPFGRDQGIFATTALMLREGRVLYRDIFEVKPPYIHLAYSLAFSLFGERMAAVNLLDLLFRLAALLPIALLGGRLLGRGGGLLAAALYGLLSTAAYDRFWMIAQTETFAAPLTALGMWAHLRSLGSPRRGGAWALLGGAAFGAAAGFKVTALVPFLAVLLDLRLRRPALGPRGALRLGLAAAAGICLSFVPFAAYLVAHHAVGEFLEVQARFNAVHAAVGSGLVWGKLLLQLRWVFLDPLSPLSLTLSLAGAAVVLAGRARPLYLVAAWWALAYATVPLQGKFWHYHFLMALPPHAILAAYLLRRAAGWWRRGTPGGLPAALAVAVLSAATLWGQVRSYVEGHRDGIAFLLGRLPREEFEARFETGMGDYRFPAIAEVARFVKDRSTEGDGLLCFNLDQTINFLARRLPPTRFLYDYPLTVEAPGYGPLRERFREEFLRDLEARPPRFLVTSRGDVSPIEAEDSLTSLQRFEAFLDLVRRRYAPARVIGPYVVLERKG